MEHFDKVDTHPITINAYKTKITHNGGDSCSIYGLSVIENDFNLVTSNYIEVELLKRIE